MILSLIFPDRAAQLIPPLVLITAFVGYGWSVAVESDGQLTVVDIGACWVILAGFLTLSHFWVRANSWQLALPLPARKIWLRRVMALAGGSLMLIGAIVLMAAIRSSFDPRIFTAGLHICGGMLLTVAALLARKPGLSELQPDRRLILESGLISVAVLWVTYQLMQFGGAWGMLTFPAAATILAWTYRTLPAAFRIVPDAPAPARNTTPYVAENAGAPLVWIAYRLIYDGQWTLVAIMIALLALLPGSRQFSWLVVAIMPVMFVPVVQRLPLISHLPISRRLIFALGILPVMVLWLTGSAAGAAFWGYDPGTTLLIFQPGGPETLTWMQFRPEARTWAVVAVLCGVMLTWGVAIQLARVLITRERRSTAYVIGILGAGYALPLLLVMWITTPAVPWAPATHEIWRYHAARFLEHATGLFPNGWVAWLVAAGCLACLYRFVERLFMRAEARGTPDCELL